MPRPKGGWLIRVDVKTHDRFVRLAGELPLARYLRGLASELSGDLKPVSAVEKLERRVHLLEDAVNDIYRYPNDAGQLMVTMLRKYDAEHPTGEADLGFYHRDSDLDWHFIQERFDKWSQWNQEQQSRSVS